MLYVRVTFTKKKKAVSPPKLEKLPWRRPCIEVPATTQVFGRGEGDRCNSCLGKKKKNGGEAGGCDGRVSVFRGGGDFVSLKKEESTDLQPASKRPKSCRVILPGEGGEREKGREKKRGGGAQMRFLPAKGLSKSTFGTKKKRGEQHQISVKGEGGSSILP